MSYCFRPQYSCKVNQLRVRGCTCLQPFHSSIYSRRCLLPLGLHKAYWAVGSSIASCSLSCGIHPITEGQRRAWARAWAREIKSVTVIIYTHIMRQYNAIVCLNTHQFFHACCWSAAEIPCCGFASLLCLLFAGVFFRYTTGLEHLTYKTHKEEYVGLSYM